MRHTDCVWMRNSNMIIYNPVSQTLLCKVLLCCQCQPTCAKQNLKSILKTITLLCSYPVRRVKPQQFLLWPQLSVEGESSLRVGHAGTCNLGSVPSISLSIHTPSLSSLWWTSMLVALLEPLLGAAPSSLEWERDREWELVLDLERDFLLLSEEVEVSDEESLGSSPVKTGLKRQKYFL